MSHDFADRGHIQADNFKRNVHAGIQADLNLRPTKFYIGFKTMNFKRYLVEKCEVPMDDKQIDKLKKAEEQQK